MNGGRRERSRRREPSQKPRSKEDPREAKARDRARILVRKPFTSPRPGTSAVPASRPSPTRPAPQSQSLFRSYGSNLPTSLTYIILSTRGSSPWRPAADMGTNQIGRPRGPRPDFQGPRGRCRHRRKCGALRALLPISLLEASREYAHLYRKDNSPGSSRRRLRGMLGYPDEL